MAGYITLKGSNYDVGYQLGQYWGDYFEALDRRERSNNKLYNDYFNFLENDDFDETNIHLLLNMKKCFSYLYDELRGMVKGINDSKMNCTATLYGLFTCWLAETDLTHKEYNGCSSVIIPINDGFFMTHSDEYYAQYPMVAAKVTLQRDKDAITFFSVSHPFQLLGSGVGMNRYFAFQGNSIGCCKEIFNEIKRTPAKRIPKTVFTRIMLEMSAIKDIEDLYYKHSSTLPSHHYVITPCTTCSFEIQPDKIGVTKKELPATKRFHTNHFIGEGSNKWKYNDSNESRNRLEYLEKKLKYAKTEKTVKDAFLKFLDEYTEDGGKSYLIERTSGVFFFTIQNEKQFSCEFNLFKDNKKGTVKLNQKVQP